MKWTWSVSLFVVLWSCTCNATTREFYIGCVEEEWDYSPEDTSRPNVSRYGQSSFASMYLNQSADRIGHKYKKALYKEYTDNTFRIRKPVPVWLGFNGPILEAEVGDIIVVNFKNMATRSYSIHPHGLNYTKSNEGADYGVDGARSGIVPPGLSFTYTWTVSDDSGPADGDPDCISWLYHSHVSPVEDLASGLLGFILTCRRGKLENWKRTRQYAVYVSVVDENLSWYLDDNIATYTTGVVDKDDEDFQESNKMHAINGYVYGHLPGLSACVGETIHWHMASFGTEVDVHSLAISGHSFEYFHHREDSIQLTVATSATASMLAYSRGIWSLNCQVDEHLRAGMEAFLTIDNCDDTARPEPSVVHTRRYYITAEEMLWDYAPFGRNRYDGGSLTEEGSDSEVFFKKDSSHIGGVYKKVLYQEYTNFLFREKKVRSPEEKHLGFLGPVIRAEVGDQVKVVFYNKASRPYSIHAHGVQFSQSNTKREDIVDPGRIHTYFWNIPEEMGPTEDDTPCLTRMYTSGVDVIRDSHSGLVGPLLVCRRGSLDTSGYQVNVTREFFLHFSVTDENKSWYLEDNIVSSGVHRDIDTNNTEFVQSNLMHGINGRLYGNLEGVSMCVGDEVSLHVLSVSDFHTLTFNGDSFIKGQAHKVTSELLPGTMSTYTMIPKHSGSWGFSCSRFDHFTAGAKAIYTVKTCNNTVEPSPQHGGDTVRKYIQATMTEWNYLPDMMDMIDKTPVHRDFGSTYVKALFKEYTDDTFLTPVPRKNEEKYLGFLGPVIRVEVGDVLEIVFKNAANLRKFSIKAQGLLNNAEDLSDTFEPSAAPGETIITSWNVSESSGPGAGDGACVTRVYHSNVDYVRDISTGLIGPLIICRRGELSFKPGSSSDKKRTSVHKDFVGYFAVVDENMSWYLNQTIDNFYTNASAVDTTSEEFIKNNLLYSINGFIFGNQPSPTMTEGNDVEWYLITMGTNIHAIHFHGNEIITTENKQHTSDVVPLLPMMTMTVRMRAVNQGKWLYHCHVDKHYKSGMRGLYQVERMTFLMSRASE